MVPGTYDVTSLISELNAQSSAFNILFEYNPLTLKVSISHTSSVPFLILNSSTITGILGFNTTYNYDDISAIHISNTVVSVNNTYDYIHITTDIVE